MEQDSESTRGWLTNTIPTNPPKFKRREPSLASQWQIEIHDRRDDWVFDANELDVPYWVIDTEDCVIKIVQSNDQLFPCVYNPHLRCMTVQPTKLGKQLLICLRTDFHLVGKMYPNHRLSPHFELLARKVSESGLSASDFDQFSMDTGFNQLVKDLRAEATTVGFKDMIGNQRRAMEDNRKSLIEYISDLFDRHSKLLVVRIDVGFPPEFRASLGGRAPNPEYVRRCMQKFQKNLNRKFPSLAGFAKKFECGAVTGYHYHLLFFFNGQKVREDITIGDLLCKRWIEKTQGYGKAWNCNRDKAKYRARGTLGIGMVRRKDKELRANLETAALYLVKIDYFVRLNLPPKWKAFIHGQVASAAADGSLRNFKNNLAQRVKRAKRPIIRGKLT